MGTEKNIFFSNKRNFLFFKIFLWICAGFAFINFSVIIPTTSLDLIKELIVFLGLICVINLHTSYLYQLFSKKKKLFYIILLTSSIIICALFEVFFFSENINNVYCFLDKRKIYLHILGYTIIRDLALFIVFFWVEYFNRLIYSYHIKEKIHQAEIALLIEKQEFEKNFSRKKLLPHYFFNILEHINMDALRNNSEFELINKIKFILYYFLVDAEKDRIELDKELAFYKYYIELEAFRHRKNISVDFNILGKTEDFTIIPLLFEPIINNAMKYTKHDGKGWVNIIVDALCFPILKFYCKNNFSHHPISNITSTESGLKILEQRLELCYKNKHALIITQDDDLYDVALTIEVI